MAKSPYDDDSDDDSYNADWNPNMEQAPVQSAVQTKPAAASLDSSADLSTSQSGRGHSASASPQRPSKHVPNGHQGVSFSLDNVPDDDGGYGNSYHRPSNIYRDDAKQTDEEKAAKRSARYASTVTAPVDNKKHRVRPYRCFSEPTYMTEDEIYADMMKPSKTAAFLKSHFPPSTSKIPGELHLSDHIRSMYDSPEVDGRIGSVRVEVLGAVGLARQKPYCAVYLVSGDCAFCTDVLNNFRSPMWPSACTRAAVFPVHHAYARVFVGLFDVKKRQNKDNDVFLGRVVIDIAQLRPNTEYDVTFPMRASSFVYDRRKRGVIRLRFSLHWFSERAAICSYLKSSRWFSQSEPTRGLGQPTIPCAEPKTFRNIAVTCHGQDFPGKYTRMAFRATMREFNLYHINLRFMLKTLMLDALLYERPHISLYLFLAFQHCIYANIVRMVPPYFSGYVILLFLDNYRHFNISEKFTLGYKPLTVQEIMVGLIKDGKSDKPTFLPAEIKKRAKKRAAKKGSIQDPNKDNSYFGSTFGSISPYSTFSSLMGINEEEEQIDDGEIEPRDHREFPFSERDEYPKFSVQEALAPSTKAPVKGEEGNNRLAGRLSIYFVKEEEKEDQGDEKEDDDEDEDEENDEEDEDSSDDDDDDENEEENIENAADIQVEDVDTYDMDLEPEEDEVKQSGGAGLFDVGSSKMKRARVRVGPPQNCDISSKKKTPPQQTLQKIEKQMHKLSKGIALERVITVPGARKYGPEPGEDEKKGKKSKSSKEDVLNTKRSHYDEFDKVLGLQSKTANPVLRITSSFLGPLMRMIRIFLYAMRVSFNMATWRDPYFSFWILCFLVTQTIVLLIFPWRPFLFISSFLCLGPQNIFVRKYLEKKAAEKAMEKTQTAKDDPDSVYPPVVNESKIEPVDPVAGEEKAEAGVDKTGMGSPTNPAMPAGQKPGASSRGVNFANQPKSQSTSKKSSGLLGKFKSTKKLEKTYDEMFSFDTEVVDNIEQRPAFSTGHNSRTSKKTRPREVAVPYSKLRKDRFFDWPPDPTVSRATPLPGPWLVEKSAEAGEDGEGPLSQPIPKASMSGGTGTRLDPELETLRRRYVAEQGAPMAD